MIYDTIQRQITQNLNEHVAMLRKQLSERDARIVELERILDGQRERIAELEQEHAKLHAALRTACKGEH